MVIMVGIDMHVKNLVCEIGFKKEEPLKRTYQNNFEGHIQLIKQINLLKKEKNAKTVLAAYEASGLGYLLYDRFKEEGFRCVVLAPTELLRSATGFKKKTDKKDASYIYETIRGHVLAGNKLHDIWIPDKELREDRDIVRTRFDLGKKISTVKIQIHSLLKRYGIIRPEDFELWTKAFRKWLIEISLTQGNGFKNSLLSLIRQLTFLEDEEKFIEKQLEELSEKERYKKQSEALLEIKGVGLLTTMTFLTEIGDITRFNNRRQIGAYIGIVPSSFESGDNNDRKGRITRNGPYRLRSVLNQAVWMHLRYDGKEKALYERIAEKNPKRKKKAVVACMRRLAIRMWHIAYNVINENTDIKEVA